MMTSRESLADLMGDESRGVLAAPKKLSTPKTLAVTVRRVGVEVEFSIGDSDPKRMGWVEALRLGDRYFVEGARAAREKRPAELRLGHAVMHTEGRALQRIGQWLMAKATEAKYLDGAAARRVETR